MLIVVEMKIVAAKIEDIPDKCREQMSRSTEDPSCAIPLAGEDKEFLLFPHSLLLFY